MDTWRVCRRGFIGVVVACSISSLANAQIAFVESSDAAGLPNQTTPTYGLSVGDINGDGLPDVFANNHALRNSIFLNDPLSPGVFHDVARDVDAEHFWDTRPAPGQPIRAFRDTHGAVWMDYDNDGDQDLVISTGTCCDPDFFINDAGMLYQRTVQLGFGNDADHGGRASLWYDSNGDGDLEMSFVTTFTGRWFKQQDGRFVQDLASNYNCSNSHFGVEVDITANPNLEMLCVAAGGPFAKAWDVSTRPFRNVTSVLPAVPDVNDVVLGDFDGNSRTDLMLLKGALRPGEVISFARPAQGKWGIESLINGRQRGFSFRSTGPIQVRLSWNGTFANFSNVNIGAKAMSPKDEFLFTLDPNDSRVVGTPPRTAGIPELNIDYVPSTGTWNFEMYPGNTFLDAYLIVTSSAPVTNVTTRNFDTGYDRARPITLLSNTAQGIVDVTSSSGLATTRLPCASGVAGDFDNDMDLDVYLTCRGGARNLSNVLLQNNGHGVFTIVPAAGGAGGVTGLAITDHAGTSDSAVTLDYDLDGRLDVLVSNGLNLYPEGRPGYAVGGRYELFRNVSPKRNWLQIDLVGTQSSRDALGAKVFVDSGGVRQFRQQDGGLHRSSQNSKRLHFGLAANLRANITVRWQNGTQETFANVAANKVYRITEGGGIRSVF